MRFQSLVDLAAASAALLLAATPAWAQPIASPLAPNAWAQAASDLKPDPQIRYGRLPNGMTYALMRNATPTGEASVRLRIAAGSLMESDAQQGLAHFLEHMAFNGSTHVPTGEMIKILERHGLAFGADTNASTSWMETIYKLDLPKTDADTVDTSLMLLREIAGELTLPQAAMDKERGVVLSEERLGDSPSYRGFKERLQFMLPGQKVSERLPIGQTTVIANAPRSLLKDFYDRFYRPDRATLVAVGDFDLDAMEAKIKASFSNWENHAPAGGPPQLGAPAERASQSHVMVEEGAPFSLQVAWIKTPDLSVENEAKDRDDLVEGLALAVLNRRLERLSREASAPFIGAGASVGDMFDSARITTLQMSAQPDSWNTALSAVEGEQRKLVRYGVLKSELNREIAETRTSLAARAAQAATRRTPDLANDLVASLADRSVVQNPVQELAQFERDVKSITVEQVDAAARKAFSGSGPLVFMTTPKSVPGGDVALSDAFKLAQAQPIAAPTALAQKAWPYERFGAAGKVVERRQLDEFGATMVRFDNGVRLTVKPTQFRKSEVTVQARIGNGRLGLSKTTPSAIWASSAFVEGGLKQMSMEQIDQAMTSKVVGARFGMDDDAFVLSGGAKASDLDAELQLLTAYVTEPGFRPEAFERMRAYGLTLNSQLEATPAGLVRRDLTQLLHGGDPRWSSVPTAARIQASKPDELQALLAPALSKGAVEVVIVGDIDVDKAIALTASTFGALHRPTVDETPVADSLKVAFPQASATPVIERHKGRPDQAMAAVAWRTNDFYSDMKEARALSVLGQIMQRRMIDDLRIDKGDTYSPNAGEDPSQTFPGYGYLMASVEIPPAKIDVFYDSVRKIVQDLRTKPVGQDELDRAILPRVDAVEKARETNDYWAGVLGGAQVDSRRLEAVRTQISQVKDLTPADLERVAQKYLDPDKAWRFEALPQDYQVAAK